MIWKLPQNEHRIRPCPCLEIILAPRRLNWIYIESKIESKIMEVHSISRSSQVFRISWFLTRFVLTKFFVSLITANAGPLAESCQRPHVSAAPSALYSLNFAAFYRQRTTAVCKSKQTQNNNVGLFKSRNNEHNWPPYRLIVIKMTDASVRRYVLPTFLKR